jgi:hypothetical protein
MPLKQVEEKDEGVTWRWTIFSPVQQRPGPLLGDEPRRLRVCAAEGELQASQSAPPGSSTANPKSTSTADLCDRTPP